MRAREYFYGGLVAAALVLFGGVLSVSAEEPKTKKGLRFNVPEDWPVEERGGGLAPVPVEEYVLKRFKQVQDGLDALRGDLTARLETCQGDVQAVRTQIAQDLEKVNESMRSLHQDVRVLQSQTPRAPDDEDAGDEEALNAKLDALRQDLVGAMEDLKRQVDAKNDEQMRRLVFDFGVLEEKFSLLSEEVQDLKR